MSATSDNESSTDYGALITQFLKDFWSFKQACQLYSRDNDHLKGTLRNLRGTLSQCFDWRNPISLTIMQERLYFEESLIKSRLPIVADFIDILLERLIRKIVINKNVRNDELYSLVRLLHTQPVKIRDTGGPRIMLSDDLGAKNITILELSMFFSDDVSQVGTWKSAVQKAGMDVDEVAFFMRGPEKSGNLVAVDNADPMSLSLSGLMRQETSQLIELLMNPEILSHMILELSTVSTADGPMVDPAEIIRIVTRTENTLLFRSYYSQEKIKTRITAALKMLDRDIRIAILQEFLQRRTEGLNTLNMALFQFTPQEWGEAMAGLYFEEESRDCLKQVIVTSQAWQQLQPHFDQAFNRHNGKLAQERRHIAAAFQKWTIPSEANLPEKPQAETNWDQFNNLENQQLSHNVMDHLKRQLKDHIETGYANTLLGLLQFEEDPVRSKQIMNNFFEHIHQMVERENLEAVALLNRFHDFMSAKDTGDVKLLADWLQKDGRDFLGKLLSHVSNLQLEKNRETLRELLPLLSMSGKPAIAEMLDKIYFDTNYSDNDQLMDLVAPVKFHVLDILTSYIDEKHFNFSPRRFLKAMGLFLTSKGHQAEPPIKKCLNSEKRALRMAALIRLLHMGDNEIAIRSFRETMWNPTPATSDEEKIIAAYGLGIRKDQQSAEQLRKMAKGYYFKENESPDLRFATMFAFAAINGTEARRAVGKIFRKIMRAKRFYREKRSKRKRNK